MTEATCDADGSDVFFLFIPDRFDTHNGVVFEKKNRVLWIVKVNLLRLQQRDHGARQLVGINFEPNCQCLLRRQPWTLSTMFFARNWFVEPELTSPECFVAERVKAENLLSVDKHFVGICVHYVLERRATMFFRCSSASHD